MGKVWIPNIFVKQKFWNDGRGGNKNFGMTKGREQKFWNDEMDGVKILE